MEIIKIDILHYNTLKKCVNVRWLMHLYSVTNYCARTFDTQTTNIIIDCMQLTLTYLIQVF